VRADGEVRTWGGLAAEVRYWGEWVLTKVKAEIGDLYPPIPDPEEPLGRDRMRQSQTEFASHGFEQRGQVEFFRNLPGGYLTPVAYLWTRTVTCKNPSCKATVPLVKQTWLCKKKNRSVALRMIAPKGQKQVRFAVVESATEKGIGFDPTAFSKAGNATCPFCGTVADSDYVMAEGCATRISQQMMATVCVRAGKQGKTYIAASASSLPPDAGSVQEKITDVSKRHGVSIPNEPISPLRPSPNARGLSGLTRYGIVDFGQLFTSRQHLLLISLCDAIRSFPANDDRSKCIATYLAVLVGRIANQNCAFTGYHSGGEKIEGPMGDKKVPMVWDFPETNPFSGVTGGVDNALDWIVEVCNVLALISDAAQVQRGDATRLDMPSDFVDAVVTDPPYYDNVPYADISDFFYVWFKRAIGHLYPDHFSSLLTPKKAEATALASRHDGDMAKANAEYESAMSRTFQQAQRVLKPAGQMVVVYAHKTTLGWATLVDALRRAGLVVTEAWPLDTEMAAGKVKIDRAMLASSIFLIARKRERDAGAGAYEDEVQPELERIVRERVEALWELGVTGADLLIAGVGAGLRAFTRFDRVEYANGEEVPAEKFLAEVEGVVLETLMEKILGVSRSGVAAVDPASRFYVLWRYVYKATEIEAGEAIVFTYGQHVELDGPNGLSAGSKAVLEKKKGSYRLRDFTERGDDDDLGLPHDDGRPTPIIDALHRTMWLMENRPGELPEFLREAEPNREQMRLVAQALAGPALKGGELADVSPSAEQAALAKLTANWRSVVEDAMTTTAERQAKRTGQRALDM
jgi:putative DNA methylase